MGDVKSSIHSLIEESDLDVVSGLSRRVALIFPESAGELRRADDNLTRGASGYYRLAMDGDMDAGAEAEDKASVLTIKNQVAAGQKHLAWGGDNHTRRRRGCAGHGSWQTEIYLSVSRQWPATHSTYCVVGVRVLYRRITRTLQPLYDCPVRTRTVRVARPPDAAEDDCRWGVDT